MPEIFGSPNAVKNRSRSSTTNTLNSSSLTIKKSGSNSSTTKRNRPNLVLSTSFISTKRLENAPPSPASPLQTRRPRTNVSKALLGIRSEISHLQQLLIQTRKHKEDAERIRDSAPSEIYKGTYSTDHLHVHSMRIRTNTQIRELDKSMKKTEKHIADLKQQLEQVTKTQDPCNKSRLNLEPTNSATKEDLQNTHEGDEDESMKLSPLKNEKEAHDNRELTDDEPLLSQHDSEIEEESDSYDGRPALSNQSEDISSSTNIETATWLVSDFMQSLQDTNMSVDFILAKANGLVSLLKEHPEIRRNLVLSSFMNSIQSLLLSEDSIITSAAYRICRYLIDDVEFVEWLLKLRLDAFIIISLAKDNSHQMEREQALRLVRTFSDYHANIPKGIVQAVISCIEKQDDTLRNMTLETLLELCFVNPQVVNECHGMRVLESILQDYTLFPVASIILDAVLHLMSTRATRVHFLDDLNISVLFTVFSDTNTRATLNVEKMQNACLLISKALKDYNGLMLFSMDNFRPLKELLSFFQIPLCAHYLIDIFLDVLRIKKLSFNKSTSSFKLVPSHFSQESMLINQHVTLLILIMYNSGFIDHIWELLSRHKEEEKLVSNAVVAKARYLLSEFLNMAMNLLDIDVPFANKAAQRSKTSFYDETFEFGKVSYNMNKSRNTLGMVGIDYGKNVKSISQNIKESSMGREVDDMKFRKMVYDSKVLQTKDFSKWNWNIIQELLEGPLLNAKLLDELVKSTKFIRRLLIFYRPLRLRFSAVEKGARLSQKYVQVGCQFFQMLTSTSLGMKIFMDDTKIIPQLASLLFRAMEGHTSGNIINEASLKTKIIVGYFKFVGVLTQSSNGILLLKRWNFFTVIYKMFDISSTISLKLLLLTLPEMDLKYSGHCRTIMGKALVIPNEEVRIKATENLGEKLQGLSKFTKDTNDKGMLDDRGSLQRYIMEMLTRQLYDLSPKVVAISDQALYNFIIAEECSQEMGSSLRKSLKQMAFIRSPILFEIMGTPYGFQLLSEINFVQDERKSWLETKNREYVSFVEDFLSASQYSAGSTSTRGINQVERLPQHFYESLARTEDGISLIGQSGDLVDFINIIKKYIKDLTCINDDPLGEVIEIKSALWCVGYIGSTELGIGLLDNYALVEDIIQISYEASETMVRFTAFFALGLISKTKEGCEIMDEMGWSCCLNVQGSPMGITYPTRLDSFLSYNEKKWSMYEDYKEEMLEFDTKFGELVGDVEPIKLNLDVLLKEKDMIENPLNDGSIQDLIKTTEQYCIEEDLLDKKSDVNTNEEDKIIESVADTVSQLGNHILSSNAIKVITDMNNKYGPRLFESEVMFLKILDMMAKYRFKPHVRKFLCGLFINNKALENVIRHDRKK